MSVAQYETKFTKLARFAPHMVEDDARKAYKFKRGLRPSIRLKLLALMIRTFSGIMAHAMIMERAREEFQAIREQQQMKHPCNQEEPSKGNQRQYRQVGPAS